MVAVKGTYEPIARNFKLLAHHELNGFGGMGEGMSIQIAKDGRRILWLAHESAPKNFTAVDVSDPRAPKVVVQTDLPAAHMRSNSLETVGDIMAVAYQVQKHGQKPAGFELFDISVPETPEVHRLRRCLGAGLARRAPAVVLRRRDRAHGGRRARLRGHQPARRPVLSRLRRAQSVKARGGQPLVDARHPSGRQRAAARAPHARRATTRASAPTTPTSIRSAPIAAISATSTAACSSSTSPTGRTRSRCAAGTTRRRSRGFTHTVLPLFERELLVVTDESVVDDAKDWPKLIWIIDGRDETNPVPIATCPVDRRGGLRQARRPLRRPQHPRERAAADLVALRPLSSSAPSSTAACAPTTSPIPTGPRRSARSCRPRRAARPPAPSSSTTCSSTSARSSTPSTAISAASTYWR